MDDPNKPRRSFVDFVKAHNVDDMTSVLKQVPCAREGLLYGISAGTGAGILGFLKRGRLISAGNWGFVTFAVVAVLAKQLCHFQRMHQHARNRMMLEAQSKPEPTVVDGFEPASSEHEPCAGES
ncbi:hypothetical protein GGF46_001129 [Coemansia sp. RSA 552]|nr:hypothetical protein GGF46_001129 [Coemansia sp. RSA 552]